MRKYSFLIIIFLIVVSCAAFGRIAGNDFVNYDDTGFIVENYPIQSGFNMESIQWAFSTIEHNYWIPLTWLSHILDWSIFGANASAHHIVSLLLHIGSVIFLFLFLNKTTNNLWPAAFAAALFALHPLRVESVAWAAERKDVLSMFFGMASLYAYAFYVESSNLSKYLLCLILFVLALMSKPMMVTLPCILMLLDYWPMGRWQKALSAPIEHHYQFAGRLVWEKAPFFLLTLVSCMITFWAQTKVETVASESILPIVTRVPNAIFSYAVYLEKTFWPVNLAVFYPYDFSLPLWKVLISGIILILITAAVFYYIRKWPFLFTGWLWYLGTLIPLIGLVQVGKQAMADRYTYLPSIGIAVMIAWGIPSLIKNENTRKKILFPTAIAILFVLAILTWTQCGYWKNSVELWNHALQATKNNDLAHNNLGRALFEKGNINKAVYHYNKAILLMPHDYGYYGNRGQAYAGAGMYQQALEDYNMAIRLKPDFAEGYNNRGNIYGQHSQYQMAIDDFNKAIGISPNYIKAYNNRGLAYSELRQYQSAIENFNKAIGLRPDYAIAYNNRATAHLKQGDNIAGCNDAQKACALGNCITLEAAKDKGYCQ